ncbi:methyl-accepting chemotaxis protein [Pseudomonas sp. ChxA]|uniref:methyl-accepting chemotaxis protein n=2 Tax=Pseudomonas TaxID=286 RepID=UPI000BFC7D40|nr:MULTISPECIES: methyl-accepting chemotaxis protein [unclassified Pseudomonas]ATN08259.1 methyl-accepting chemotaxis protein [Pseudomonas sp. FDAARGOS_380]MDL2189184.1 methyl-accepting chemotaxis protein [Pseudomonas sp. ChxA]
MIWFLNLRLAAKLSISFLVCALITVAIGFVGMSGNSRLGDTIASIFGNNVTSINKVNESLQQVIYHNRDLYLLLAQKAGNASEAELATTQKALSDRKRAVESSFAIYRSTPLREDEKVLGDKFETDWPSYIKAAEQFSNTLNSGDLPGARSLLTGDVSSKYGFAEKEMLGIIASNIDQADDMKRESDVLIQSSKLTLIAGMVIAFVLAMGLGLLITRLITRPLSYAVAAAELIAAGDLTQRIDAGSQDETGQLLSSLGGMQASLRNTIQNISSASDRLASAAEELSVVTDESTRGLTQQNSEIEQAATAVNEMTAAVDEVARNAVTTAEISQRTNQDAMAGKSKVGEAVLAIEDMVGEINSSSSQVQELAHQTKEISKVLEVIRSIADQTNLLALNAAIEAARAGEQGRGFAVVADEVRALAHRTQSSTVEIEGMINSAQTSATSVVQTMSKSQRQADNTRQLAQAAGVALESITEGVAAITERNLVIASASEEQAQVAREVDRNLVNIQSLSAQTATGAHQTNASSHELSRLAVSFNQLVAQFKL